MIEQALLAKFVLVFCRIAGMIMVFPGLSSPRIPARTKIALAVFMTLLIAPQVNAASAQSSGVAAVVIELLAGVSLAMIARLLFYAAETAGSIISMMIGLSSAFGGANDEAETLPILSTLLTFTLVLMIFASDMHHLMIIGARKSFDLLPIGMAMDAQGSLMNVTEALRKMSLMALQISAPFIILGMIGNLTAGILNRIVQQVPIYFVFTPLVTLAGLVVLWAVSIPVLVNLTAMLAEEIR